MPAGDLPSSLAMLVPGPPATYPSTKGTVYLWEPAPRILVTRVVGVLTAEGASAIEMAGRRLASKYGKHAGYHDWESMSDYEAAARARLVQFGLETIKLTDTVHIYATSKLVQLGLQAASIALPKIHIHTTRGPFEATLQRAVSEARR
jgi:hypothetical protein